MTHADQAAAFLRIPASLENMEPGVGSFETCDYDLTRAWPDPGFGGFGYLKAPFKHKEDQWEEDPQDDVVSRLRFKSERRKTYVYQGKKVETLRIEREGEGWAWVLTVGGGDG